MPTAMPTATRLQLCLLLLAERGQLMDLQARPTSTLKLAEHLSHNTRQFQDAHECANHRNCADPPMQKAPVGEHLPFTQVILAVMVGVTTAMIVTNVVVLSTSVRVLPKTVSPGQELG